MRIIICADYWDGETCTNNDIEPLVVETFCCTPVTFKHFFFTFNQFSPLFLGHWMHVSFSIGFLFLCLSLVLIWSLTHCLDISRLTKKCLLLSFVATVWLLIYTINDTSLDSDVSSIHTMVFYSLNTRTV